MSVENHLQDLQSLDSKTRLRALFHIGILGDSKAIPALKAVYENDSSPELRNIARVAAQHIEKTKVLDLTSDARADVQWAQQFIDYLKSSQEFSPDDIQDIANTVSSEAAGIIQNSLNRQMSAPDPRFPFQMPGTSTSPMASLGPIVANVIGNLVKDHQPGSPGPSKQVKGTYQMFWDCEYCGATKLLGVTHRHCPSCGAAQNPNRRYFPAPGEEIALENHEYVGVDVVCPSCSQPNSAKAEFCINCGTPLTEAAKVKLHPEQFEGGFHEDKADPVMENHLGEMRRIALEEKKQRAARPILFGLNRKQLTLVGGAFFAVLTIVGGIFAFTYRRSEVLTVDGHEWERIVHIEELRRERDRVDGSCSNAPSEAYNREAGIETRSRQVPDGESCRTVCTDRRVDNGDGSFSVVEDCSEQCTTRYRTEYYTVPVCRYDINRWRDTGDEEKAGDKGKSPEPYWPEVNLPAVSNPPKLGEKRIGEREETYTLLFVSEDNERERCEYSDMNKWLAYNVGDKVEMEFTILDKPDCKSLKKVAE